MFDKVTNVTNQVYSHSVIQSNLLQQWAGGGSMASDACLNWKASKTLARKGSDARTKSITVLNTQLLGVWGNLACSNGPLLGESQLRNPLVRLLGVWGRCILFPHHFCTCIKPWLSAMHLSIKQRLRPFATLTYTDKCLLSPIPGLSLIRPAVTRRHGVVDEPFNHCCWYRRPCCLLKRKVPPCP